MKNILFKNSIIRKPKRSLKKDLNRYFSKETVWVAKDRKGSSTLVIKEMQIKTAVGSHCTHRQEELTVKRLIILSVSEDGGPGILNHSW